MGEESDIKTFYSGRKVLITGASGFIGKVLLWKLLHSCSSIDTIYTLIRPKRGQSVQLRLEKLLEAPIYNDMKRENPKLLEKVIPVCGDIAYDNLELSKSDRDVLVNQVSVVFHIAAALNMDADLKTAVNMNTEGTLRMLELASEMKNLTAFVHTSTAYCYCDKEATEEVVSPPLEDPMDVINLTKWMPSNLLKQLTPGLIRPHPNTYTYTKRLAEKLVADYYSKLPVVIARPSIVIPSIREPFPGWVDNLNGPVGLLIAAGKGVLRSMLCDGQTPADMVGVDIVSNGLLATAWRISTQKNKDKCETVPVFNLTSAETKPLLWQEIIDYGKEAIAKYPFKKVLWYPGGKMTTNENLHILLVILLQWIPAYFIDFLLLLFGQRTSMVHVQRRINQGQKVLQYFTIRTWRFGTHNLLQLKESMNATDQATFPVTMKGFDDRLKYIEDCIKVTRLYLVKDDPSTIPECRKKMKVLYAIDCFARFVGIMLLFWLGVIAVSNFVQYFELDR